MILFLYLIFPILRQRKVAILDSYCILVSLTTFTNKMPALSATPSAGASSSFDLWQCDGNPYQQFTALKGFNPAENWCSSTCPPSGSNSDKGASKPSTDCSLLDLKCQIFKLLVSSEEKNHEFACSAWYVGSFEAFHWNILLKSIP